MIRTILQSLLAGAALAVIYLAVQIGQGVYMTIKYVPDIAEAYNTVEPAASEVSFGRVESPNQEVYMFIFIVLAGSVLFILGKLGYRRYLKKS